MQLYILRLTRNPPKIILNDREADTLGRSVGYTHYIQFLKRDKEKIRGFVHGYILLRPDSFLLVRFKMCLNWVEKS